MLRMAEKLTATRLKPEQLKTLEKIATHEDLPVSWLIRKAIDEFLSCHKEAGRLAVAAAKRP